MFKNPLLSFRQRITSVHENLLLSWVAIYAAAAYRMEQSFVLPIAPVLVSLHPVTVIQCDRATVRDGIEAELPGVKWLPRADVFSPTKGEELFMWPRSFWAVLHTDVQPQLRPCGSVFAVHTEVGRHISNLPPCSRWRLHRRVVFGDIPSHCSHEPLEIFTLKVLAQLLLGRDVTSWEMSVLRPSLVNVFCKLIHPRLCHSLQVPC